MPFSVRTLAVLAVTAAAVATVVGPSSGATRRPAQGRVLEARVLAQINAFRARHGLRALRLSSRLHVAAAQHSTQMARVGYFSHDSADGTVFWRRIRGYYRSSGYDYWSVGENLLWAAPTVTAPRALTMWLRSPEHRANLLTRKWREIGISAVHVASAPGFYGGRAVTVITTDFGVRR